MSATPNYVRPFDLHSHSPYCATASRGPCVPVIALADYQAVIAQRDDLLALARQFASECAECDGKGYYFEGEAITGRGPDDVFPEQVACPECESIRAVITRATK